MATAEIARGAQASGDDESSGESGGRGDPPSLRGHVEPAEERKSPKFGGLDQDEHDAPDPAAEPPMPLLSLEGHHVLSGRHQRVEGVRVDDAHRPIGSVRNLLVSQ